MMRHLSHAETASRIENAMESVIRSRAVTSDLGGTLSTKEVTDAVIAAL